MEPQKQEDSVFAQYYANFLREGILSKVPEFCTEDNIDNCLVYISQELCNMGFPAIYEKKSSCPYAINCDIIKFLNVTFDLLQKHNNHIQTKDDLETRNQVLSSDVDLLRKKLSQMNTILEQNEKKYSSALERERQLKGKIEQLLSQLKSEKDELKKATSLTQQQKLAYQHEVRKHENEMNQMKSKMNQLLCDKSSEKKYASITSSHTLQRNDGTRGKWKTGTVANSRLEDVYNSIISGHEDRCKALTNELNDCCSCLEYVQSEVSFMVSCLKGDESEKENRNPTDVPSMTCSNDHYYAMFKLANKNLREDLELKLGLIRKAVIKSDVKDEANDGQENAVANFREKISDQEKTAEECKTSRWLIAKEANPSESELENLKESVSAMEEKLNLSKAENRNLQDEKASFIEAAAHLERGRATLEARKLELIRFETSRGISTHNANFTPAVPLVTTRGGVTVIPDEDQLRMCLSGSETPHVESAFNPWLKPKNCWLSKSPNPPLPSTDQGHQAQKPIALPTNSEPSTNTGLPRWATRSDTPVVESAPKESNLNSSSNDLLNISSTEDPDRLRMMSEDLERRRRHLPL